MNILVVYYSSYGHTFRLAEAIAAGAREIAGAEVRLVRVPELIPAEILHANPGLVAGAEMQQDVPIAQLSDLEWAHGVAFGSPTRFGNMAAQLKNFLDQAGGLWLKGSLEGKPGTCFSSAATMHGGHESTIISMWMPLIHLGMLVMGVPYSCAELSTTQRGGGPYGASSLNGPQGEFWPDDTELAVARSQGRRLAVLAQKLCG